ncbi:hypothetical protein HYU06_01500 [Candidatus Woesearchaeota archaeon]|nr:hypothetical protein [Candidatus Woesearchaeota archaeon]
MIKVIFDKFELYILLVGGVYLTINGAEENNIIALLTGLTLFALFILRGWKNEILSYL